MSATGGTAFGPHAKLVAELIAGLSGGPVLSLDAAHARARSLAAGFAKLPGEGTPGSRYAALNVDTNRRARELNAPMALAVDAAVRTALSPLLATALPPADHERVVDLVSAAVMWAAVYGGHPNPLGAALELVRGGFAPEVGSDDILLWRRGLAIPVPMRQLEVAHSLSA